ncbi:conserved hypothetical protein [Picosynechococcus sp. PCC 7002]|nr:conserved hypothetical protein [Picosynechococcus sp. PCC 7002]
MYRMGFQNWSDVSEKLVSRGWLFPPLFFATNCYIREAFFKQIFFSKFRPVAVNSSSRTMSESQTSLDQAPEATEPKPSYVKLAMRNMVRKGGKSLWHFFLTTAGLLGFFVTMAYLTR